MQTLFGEEKVVDNSIDFRRCIFNEGLKYLSYASGKSQNTLRPLLGKWLQKHGDSSVVCAIMAAQKSGAVDPIAFIEAALQDRPQRLNESVYRNIKKKIKDSVYVTAEEKDYCRLFETQELAKVKNALAK